MTRCVVLACGIALWLLAGCVHYQQKPLNPEQNLSSFEQRSFTEPGLRAYLETNLHRAFENWPPAKWDLETLTFAGFYFNPELEAARAKWAVARAGRQTAAERPNPVASVTPAYNSTTFTPSPWLVTASIDVPIETAGKRGYRVQEAQYLSEAARLGIATAAWDVRMRLRTALVEMWSAQRSVQLLQQQVAAQEEIVRLLESALAGGAISQAEVTRERIIGEQMRLTLIDAQNRQTQSRVGLADAIGVPLKTLEGVELSFEFFEKGPGEIPNTEAQRRALLNRADILGSLSEYAASEAALRLQIAKQYPDVHISPGYEFDQGDNKWGLGVGMELPILNQNRGPIAEAEARREQAAAQFNLLQARVVGEIEAALAAYEAARKKSTATGSLIDQVDARERQANALFEAGEVGRQVIAAARLEQATAALSQLDARLKTQEALGQLENALQTPFELPTALFNEPPPAIPEKKKAEKKRASVGGQTEVTGRGNR